MQKKKKKKTLKLSSGCSCWRVLKLEFVNKLIQGHYLLPIAEEWLILWVINLKSTVEPRLEEGESRGRGEILLNFLVLLVTSNRRSPSMQNVLKTERGNEPFYIKETFSAFWNYVTHSTGLLPWWWRVIYLFEIWLLLLSFFTVIMISSLQNGLVIQKFWKQGFFYEQTNNGL